VANTENIAQFNLCDYVVQWLHDAVAKLKKDMSKRNGTINLFGCHLFLLVGPFLHVDTCFYMRPMHFPLIYFLCIKQIFLLAILDLGLFMSEYDVLPRICKFDHVTLKRMITMAADMGKPPVSYVCSLVSIFLFKYTRLQQG
jgi:hypothetical protein